MCTRYYHNPFPQRETGAKKLQPPRYIYKCMYMRMRSYTRLVHIIIINITARGIIPALRQNVRIHI